MFVGEIWNEFKFKISLKKFPFVCFVPNKLENKYVTCFFIEKISTKNPCEEFIEKIQCLAIRNQRLLDMDLNLKCCTSVTLSFRCMIELSSEIDVKSMKQFLIFY